MNRIKGSKELSPAEKALAILSNENRVFSFSKQFDFGRIKFMNSSG
jgi:hypothetical protein